ncbi:MAG TPA: oligoendopeptidase F [Aggregatilineaceae bacterium]|nr:oligoendopeptidase F [Aggregatilineaceae bacterium]
MMAEAVLPLRRDVKPEHTWNAPSLFASHTDWEAELQALVAEAPVFQQRFQGHLADGPDTLVAYFDAFSDLYARVGKVYVYASMFAAVDTSDQQAQSMSGQAMSALSRLIASAAFASPEILAIGQDQIKQWMQQESRLAVYDHYFEDLFRQQQHVRSAEVEELLGLVSEPFGSVGRTASVLVNADLKFSPATSSAGQSLEVAQGTIMLHMYNSDREVRRTAWESYMDGHLAFKNTLASNLAAAIKQDVFISRVRRHNSALEASLFPNAIPPQVFYNLIETFRQHLPTWHRYWRLRRQVLGLDELHPYDVWSPLTSSKPTVPYSQAVDWISEGVRPLGDDYVEILRRGCLQDRWVDIYPNQNKRQGAFSSGWQGTFPFIMMSYNNTLESVSTLAHELGHSMHSYHTWQNQPIIYSDYSLFVAEVASNFHQAMVRAHLLQTNTDPAFQIALIEEAMYNFHRYFFQMPTLARFELEIHERTERGEGLTSDAMINLMADLFAEGFGSEGYIDRNRLGMTWATFGHLYANFYVFQYATGISAAHALADGILSGQPGAVDNYLSFLKAGHSLYPLDALKLAGVDMTTPAAVEKTFAVMTGYIERLENLLL